MPPVLVGGYRFLISADDFCIVLPPWVALHVFFACCSAAQQVRMGCNWMLIPGVYLDINLICCIAAAVLDTGVIISCSVAIMRPPRCPKILHALLVMRTFMGAAQVAVVAFMAYQMWKRLEWHLSVAPREQDGTQRLSCILAVVFVAVQLWAYGTVFLLLFVLSQTWVRLSSRSLNVVLRRLGASSEMIAGMIRVLLDVSGGDPFEAFTPSDILFGLLLVRARQIKQYSGVRAPAGEIQLVPASSFSSVPLEKGQFTNTSNTPRGRKRLVQEDDGWALSEINYYFRYAAGIYGASMKLLCDSMLPGTSITTPCRTCSACRAPWRRRKCCGCCYCCCCSRDADALQSMVGDAELLWVYWENKGPGTSPPLAAFIDDARRELVITIRGTADIKDCIADVLAKPAFFDPLGEASPDHPKHPPFDDDTDFFVHSGVLKCCKDAMRRLLDSNVLRAVQAGGRGVDYSVVVTGHSLGAGVACLLAFRLRAFLKVPVRSVLYEPPGGLLSKRLAARTRDLGFVTAVISVDVIPRLSIRSMQHLRRLVIDELLGCDRSKVQLTFLAFGLHLSKWRCCQRLATSVIRLGGGPRDLLNAPSRKTSACRALPTWALEDPMPWPELWPPGRLVFFRPTEHESWFCGSYVKETGWLAEWTEPEHLVELIVSSRAVEVHMLHICTYVYSKAASRLRNQTGKNR